MPELEAGWEIISTESSHNGLTLASQQQPDAILLDVMMPEMDGITMFDRLRTNPNTQNIPVILLTAKVGITEIEELEQLGLIGVIAKPFEPLTLASQVAQLLGWNLPPVSNE